MPTFLKQETPKTDEPEAVRECGWMGCFTYAFDSVSFEMEDTKELVFVCRVCKTHFDLMDRIYQKTGVGPLLSKIRTGQIRGEWIKKI